MAQNSEQGTGKHPHKSSADPQPHHEAQRQSHSGENVTEQQQHSKQSHSGGSSHSEGGQSQNSAGSGDLKSREYRDKDGNVHHHTTTYTEQHKNEQK